MQNQPISAERAVDLLVPVLPELARAETYPQWSDGSGEPRRGQRVTLYDAAGDILGATRDEHRAVLRVLLRVEGGDWDRPQTFDVAAGTLSPTFPVVLSLPEALGDVDSYRAAQLDAQRHELEDPAEPPLAVRELPEPDPARDCARSIADGHMTPVDWGDCDPQPAPARETADVPVQGDAL
jgi:hypothetical protein